MKKITLSILFSLVFFNAFSQFIFRKSDGTAITNGTILTYGPGNNYLNFRVQNTSNQDLDVKIKCTNLINTTGTQFELCYGGSCYDSVSLNGVYPDYENILAPGQSNPSQGDHFVNFNVGNGQIMELHFSVYALGFENDAINFIYRFDPLLSLNSFENLSSIGINIENTTISGDFKFNTTQNGNLSIFNLNGQLINEYKFTEGAHNVNLTSLSSAVYIANFITTDGKTSSIKIIKN
ncbi:T9SS type A sorting domain-containing protein [Flavobacterium lacus]|uniref:Putative secreted protein (Por secretion system target) n=1 Tax=Flavobacterium lacus TaxID=1353778 RepID=A0A328WXQ3_9FLAO|nr:T9SS type A sorting domain-containing protein [Flavobacterium lacus]RAR50993.1 putative secreted protein (Por secretion system target) [Flavobacterium lacus]